MRVAIVGGGVFGSVAAVEFAYAGWEVDLFERHDDLLLGATGVNQGRLHHGYHYPRSPSADLRSHADQFARRFPRAIVRDNVHHYCVASEGSHVTGMQYLKFCRWLGLPYQLVRSELVRAEAVDLVVEVPEAFIDVSTLRALLREQIARAGVRLRLGTAVDPREITGYDCVVNATYGRYCDRQLQFEVCEIALLELDSRLRQMSFVVMDGPFVSLDPRPGSGHHMLYDVVNSVHARNVGYEPIVPDHLVPLIDRGLLRTPHSRVDAMLATARRFLCGLENAEYRGSYFTVRAVLPDVDATDERPTLVYRDGAVVTIIPGKVDMAVWAAQRALDVAQGLDGFEGRPTTRPSTVSRDSPHTATRAAGR